MGIDIEHQGFPHTIVKNYLEVKKGDIKEKISLVIMNPPFHLRSDIRHISHARKFLNPGGKLAALCLNTHHRADAFKAIAETWEELPAQSFRESGTQVSVIMLTIHH